MADNIATFSAADARKITGVTQRQLDYWDLSGLVCAGTSSAKGKRAKRGKGIERRFTYADLVKIKVVHELRKSGLSLQKIRKALRVLKERNCDGDPLRDEVLVTDGVNLHRITKDQDALEDMLANGQLSFSLVFLGRLETKMRRIISLRTQEKSRWLEKDRIPSVG